MGATTGFYSLSGDRQRALNKAGGMRGILLDHTMSGKLIVNWSKGWCAEYTAEDAAEADDEKVASVMYARRIKPYVGEV